MISAFWEELFRLADQYKKEGKTLETRIVREIEGMLQRAYDRSLAMETPARKDKRKAMNAIERLLMYVPDVKYLFDSTDNSYYFQYDGFRYNRPQEVLAELLKDRESLKNERSTWKGSVVEAPKKSAESLIVTLSEEKKELQAKITELEKELKRTQRDYQELANYIKKGDFRNEH